MEPDGGLLFPSLQPEIPRNPAVVLVHLALAFPPGADLGLIGPAPDKVHDLAPRIVRAPDPGQSSPISFFSATRSAWRLSLLVRSASVPFSCVLSAISTGKRLLHFQLNRNTPAPGCTPTPPGIGVH
jgi:hypothetical protein